MAHRQPGTASWELAARSIPLWRSLLSEGTGRASQDPAARGLLSTGETEYQAVGSLLIGTSAEEARELQQRAAELQASGLDATFLDAAALALDEPALSVPECGSGLLVPTDAQLNGRNTAWAMLEACKQLGRDPKGSGTSRFHALLDESVVDVVPGAHQHAPDGLAAQTEHRRISARKAVVLAAGAWSGQLLSSWLQQPQWAAAMQPRRGHLLELSPPQGMPPLQHGMMEMSYTKHYTQHTSGEEASAAGVDITFTATTSASGTLLLGSSREFSGWGTTPSRGVVEAIMDRAGQFLPHLRGYYGDDLPPDALSTRVGLRPYAVSGLPWIGPVPGCPGLLLAAGHEGSGLTMGPATAELICSYLEAGGTATPDAADVQKLRAHWADSFLPAARIAAL